MRRHPLIGRRILEPMGFPEVLLNSILHHHERWNGTGYPLGLSGEEIPEGARIVALADAFDVMTSSRPYRAALDQTEALRRLQDGMGTQFDPAIVTLFLRLWHEGRIRVAAPGTAA